MNSVLTAAIGTQHAIDSSRPFMPDRFLPLLYTSAYASLTPAQRLRYNQLHALYVNEQIIFFEKSLVRNVLSPLLRRPLPGSFSQGLVRFIAEEDRHTAMFRELNQLCAPSYYSALDFHFVRVPAGLAALLDRVTRKPEVFPLFLWLMLIQEEKSSFYSREMLRHAALLEPRFVETFRIHLADEMGHIRWDEQLLEILWARCGALLRYFNAWALGWLLGEFFLLPKRGSWRVVLQLAEEFPALKTRLGEMRRQLLALEKDAGYHESVYSREMVPRCFARFDQWPEFRVLRFSLHSYHPRISEAA